MDSLPLQVLLAALYMQQAINQNAAPEAACMHECITAARTYQQRRQLMLLKTPSTSCAQNAHAPAPHN